VALSVAQRTDVWRRWKAGESLHTIGRAFDRPHTSIHCLLAHQPHFMTCSRSARPRTWAPLQASMPINCTCKFAVKASWVREHRLRITALPVESSPTK
jgi:hypothetical protein